VRGNTRGYPRERVLHAAIPVDSDVFVNVHVSYRRYYRVAMCHQHDSVRGNTSETDMRVHGGTARGIS
jgi:hypothetical protein